MFSFNLLTHQASTHEFNDVSLHSLLPKISANILIHFGASRMNGNLQWCTSCNNWRWRVSFLGTQRWLRKYSTPSINMNPEEFLANTLSLILNNFGSINWVRKFQVLASSKESFPTNFLDLGKVSIHKSEKSIATQEPGVWRLKIEENILEHRQLHYLCLDGTRSHNHNL